MQWRETLFRVLTPSRAAGPQITVTRDAKRATMNVLVGGLPSTIKQAMIDFLGYSELKTSFATGATYISRTTPFYLPGWTRTDADHEGMPMLWCVGVGVTENVGIKDHEYFDDGTKLPDFVYAKLTLSFSSLKYKMRDDDDQATWGTGLLANLPDEATLERYVQPMRKETIRTISAPQGMLRWCAGVGTAETVVPAAFRVPVNEPGQELTYMQMEVPAYPQGRIQTALGMVNSVSFNGYAAETLLYLPPDVEKIEQSDGRTVYNIGHKLLYLPKLARTNSAGATAGVTPRGHNWFLRWLRETTDNLGAPLLKILDYRKLTGSGNAAGVPAYGTADFHDVFRPDQ